MPEEATAGVYVVRATAPDGTAYEHRVTPADGPGQHASPTFLKEKPEGAWTFEYAAGGSGWALVEGIAYRKVVVSLPGGGPVTG